MRRKVRRWLAIGAVIIIIGAILILPRIFGDTGYNMTAFSDEIDRVLADSSFNDVCPGVNWKALARAIIQTESSFHPDSVSGAGAVGLTQVMPATGAYLAGVLGVKNYDLRDPYTSIWFGLTYFKGLLQKYDCRVDLASAAYNGGPKAVRLNTVSRSGGYSSIIGKRYEKYRLMYEGEDQAVQQAAQDNPSVPAPVVRNDFEASFKRWWGR